MVGLKIIHLKNPVVIEDVTSEKVSRNLLNMYPELSEKTEWEIHCGIIQSSMILWNYLWSILIDMLIEKRTTCNLQ